MSSNMANTALWRRLTLQKVNKSETPIRITAGMPPPRAMSNEQ